MYAVIKSGGKQYLVREGDTIRVEKLDADEGDSLALGDVLMVSDGDSVTLGTPVVEGAGVTATVVRHGRGEKIKVIKFKRRKNYRRQAGHRQDYTLLSIDGIRVGKDAG